MPDELEERLERALRGQPPAGAETEERARRSALAAMPPPGGRRGPRGRGLVAAAAVCAAALAFAGVTLAANGGRLPLVGGGPAHDRGHDHPPPRHTRPGVILPRGAVAFAVGANARAWLASSSGTALRGAPATAFALSPGAVWAVVGTDGAVRAAGVQQHGTGFERAVRGTPVAAAWAPAGIRIAYIVRTPHGDRLYDMYGNGTHNFRVARRVAAVTPSWRWDSRAFAYVAPDGRAMVHDPISGSTAAVPRACGLRAARAVAYAPFGGLLAVADASGRLEVVDTLRSGRPLCERGQAGDPAIAWLRPRQVVVAAGTTLARYDLHTRFAGVDVTTLPGVVAGLAAGDGGRRLALALRDPDGGVRVVEARTPRFSSAGHPLRVYRLLLALRQADGPVTLSWQ
jgi:hypothetical protein